jgi:hypothetical protein
MAIKKSKKKHKTGARKAELTPAKSGKKAIAKRKTKAKKKKGAYSLHDDFGTVSDRPLQALSHLGDGSLKLIKRAVAGVTHGAGRGKKQGSGD